MSAQLSDWGDDHSTVETRISVHEAVCAERYASILAMLRDTAHRVTRLEVMVLAAAGSTILGMAGLVATMALRLGKLG
ncbi:MAG TPA: hypothetical protein VKQ31_06045 [Steroidobacteraceae bacterium]|jgi:hypothetical protein|nr:hypothetical protein [Steroidobacteraceae bacterium]